MLKLSGPADLGCLSQRYSHHRIWFVSFHNPGPQIICSIFGGGSLSNCRPPFVLRDSLRLSSFTTF